MTAPALLTPQRGDILLTSNEDNGSKLVGAAEFLDELAQKHWRQADRDQLFRHAAVVATVNGSKALAIEARPRGAGYNTYRVDDPTILWSTGRLFPTDDQRTKIVAWCEEHKNAKYSWLDYALQAAYHAPIPTPGIEKALEHRVTASGHYLCSWFAAAAWAYGEATLWTPAKPAWSVAPSDLANLFYSLPLRATA